MQCSYAWMKNARNILWNIAQKYFGFIKWDGIVYETAWKDSIKATAPQKQYVKKYGLISMAHE